MYFSLFLPLCAVKALGIIENKHQKALRGEKEKKAHPENLKPKEQHDGEFSVLSFNVIYSGLNALSNCLFPFLQRKNTLPTSPCSHFPGI